MYVDSHAHLTDDRLFDDVEGIVLRAKEARLSHIVNICTDLKDLERGLQIAEKYPRYIVNVASTTPHDAHVHGDVEFEAMEKAALSGKLSAVGETGLEYFQFPETKEIQKKLFIRYLKLAKRVQLPVVIHCRDAFSDLFEILDLEYANGPKWEKGILHCFTGSLEEAKRVVQGGWYLSLSGIVTFKNSAALRGIAKEVPLENLLIETDAPWLAPQSKRGERNEPSYVVEVAKVIADVKGITAEEVARATSLNAKTIFNLGGL